MLDIRIDSYIPKDKLAALAAGLSAMAAEWPVDSVPPHALAGQYIPGDQFGSSAPIGDGIEVPPVQPAPAPIEKLEKAEKPKRAKAEKVKAEEAPSPVVGEIAPAPQAEALPAVSHEEMLTLVKAAADKKSIVFVKDAYRQVQPTAQRLSDVPPEKHPELAAILRKAL